MTDVSKVLVVGALGRMGRAVRAALELEPSLVLAAALEGKEHPEQGARLERGVPVSDDAASALAVCDVAIDFSIPSATLATASAAADAGVAYVTGTTGFSKTEAAEFDALGALIPVVRAANFSVAVNTLVWLVRSAAQRLGTGYDAEIVELHHAAKRDAPSGTALRLADAIAEGRGAGASGPVVLERAGDVGARPSGAIGVQALRGGDNAGEHTVMFFGRGERLELAHRANTRDHFAAGAVRVAAWLAGRAPGVYRVEQIFGLE
ncbi:MAG: 4-hydroxy-tetrahydrodipicolinate reductase [Deltaproteobacteria bacterium]|nr:MAG: 4-hydroxy-tetrahydrodipicolinate reductase [Deltaproteobacteria bacterium]